MSAEKIKLAFTYTNFRGNKKLLILEHLESEIINVSEYLKAQFLGKFNKTYNYDLTFMQYPISSRCIEFVFKYATGHLAVKKGISDKLKIILTNTDKMYADGIGHFFDDPLIENIGISRFFVILQLNNYFMFDTITKLINKSVTHFRRHLIFIMNAKNYDDSKISYLTLVVKKYAEIDVNISSILQELFIYKKITMANEFMDELNYVFLLFQMMDKLDVFDDIMQEINNQKLLSKKIELKHFDVKNDMYVFDVADSIGSIKLYDNYLFLQKIKNIITLKNEELCLFDYYDMLFYEEHQFKVINEQTFEKKHMIITKKECDIKFRKLTNNLFDEFEWSNVVVAGGFIYGILDNAYDSIIDSTDIDLFVYGDSDVVKNKITYINKYFEKYAPYYVVNKSVITIIIKSFRFDIQIIPTNKFVPFDIINEFDFSYVMLYYNGTNIFTNINGLVSIKHKIAIRINEKNNINDRGHKAIKKGLELVDSNLADFDINVQSDTLAKCKMIRKIIPHIEPHEIIPTIKLYYSTQHVYINVNDIMYDTNFGINNYVSVTLDNAIIKKIGYAIVKQDHKYAGMKTYKLICNEKIVTFATGYCDISRICEDFLVIFLNKPAIMKLFEIRDFVLTELCTRKKNKSLNLFKSNVIYENSEDGHQDDDSKNNYQHTYNEKVNYHLKIHLDKFGKEKWGDLTKHIHHSSKVNIKCNMIVWSCTQQDGIKFYISDMEIMRGF